MKLLSKYEVYVRVLMLTLISAALLSLYASSNTLLHHGYTFDHTIFKVVGESWADGQMLYKDIFDHKGPIMYLIQIVASSVPVPKVGTWLMEIICVVTLCEMIFRCGRYIGASKRLSYVSVVAMLTYYARYVDGGNTVEVWSLPFEILPLLMLLRYMSDHKRLLLTAFVTGLCFGIVAMLRLNNNAMISGLVAGMAINLCLRREFRRLMACMGLFVAGLSVVVVPFVIYFWAAGALDDMVYCNLTFNFHYMDNFGSVTWVTVYNNVIKLLPCVIFLITIIMYGVKRGFELPAVLFLMPIITFLTIYSGLGFNHYFLMEIPFVALGIQLTWPFSRFVKVSVIVSYVFFSIWNLKTHTFVRINELKDRLANEAASPGALGQRFVSEYIPDCDKNSVYTYGSIQPVRALNENGYLPVGKYSFLQPAYFVVDQRVHDDIINKFIEAQPKWIISDAGDMQPMNGYMDNYIEIPEDSLPSSFPAYWHIYKRKQ